MRKLDNFHILQHLHNSGAYVTVQFCIECVNNKAKHFVSESRSLFNKHFQYSVARICNYL